MSGKKRYEKYTTEDVRNFILKENYTPFLKEYKSKEKIQCTCPKGHPCSFLFNSFKKGIRCIECRNIFIGLKNRLTEDDYMNILSKFDQTFLSVEGNKLKFKCSLEHPNECSYSSFLKRRYKCKECGKNNHTGTLGYKGAKEKFDNINYTLLTEEKDYKDSHQSLDYICDNNHKNKMSVGLLMSGLRCSICNGTKPIPYIYENILSEIKSHNCEIINFDFKNMHSLIKIKCPENHVIETSINMWLKSFHKCSQCFIDKRTEKQTYKYNYIFNYFAEMKFELLSKEYINSKTLLDVKCPIGHKIELTYSNFSSSPGCYKCNQSLSESTIENILLNMKNISNTKKQKSFDNCRYNYCLRFDFYINDSFLIECDGEQHFRPIEFFGGQKSFDLQIKKDTIKNQYCIDNKIPLLRIAYKDIKNMSKILTDFIDKLEDIRKQEIPIYWSDKKLYKDAIVNCNDNGSKNY